MPEPPQLLGLGAGLLDEGRAEVCEVLCDGLRRTSALGPEQGGVDSGRRNMEAKLLLLQLYCCLSVVAALGVAAFGYFMLFYLPHQGSTRRGLLVYLPCVFGNNIPTPAVQMRQPRVKVE